DEWANNPLSKDPNYCCQQPTSAGTWRFQPSLEVRAFDGSGHVLSADLESTQLARGAVLTFASGATVPARAAQPTSEPTQAPLPTVQIAPTPVPPAALPPAAVPAAQVIAPTEPPVPTVAPVAAQPTVAQPTA